MKPLVVYTYKKCSTCRKAVKWLEAEGIAFQETPSRAPPPTNAELKRLRATQEGNLKKLFNTSGGDYREMKLGPKLDATPIAEVFELLSTNGNLVKRPFALGADTGLVGFKEEIWAAALT